MNRPLGLVNSPRAQCGVHQVFRRFEQALEQHLDRSVVSLEWAGDDNTAEALQAAGVSMVIWNFLKETMPPDRVHQGKQRLPGAKHVGFMHEVHPSRGAYDAMFDACLTLDPLIPADNHRTFHCPPPIPVLNENTVLPRWNGNPADLSVGTFGFATDGKGYGEVLEAVGREFPGATLRLHLPYATFGDADGRRAHGLAEGLGKRGLELGVNVLASHEYWASDTLVYWLSQNHLNCLFYEECVGRGVSGAYEYGLAARQPLALSKSDMFRHAPAEWPRWPDASLREILAYGAEGVRAQADAWSPKNTADHVAAMLQKLGA